MSEGNWIIVLLTALALIATFLIPRYLEMKERFKLFNIKMKKLNEEKKDKDEINDDVILALLEKISDDDLEEMLVSYIEQVDDFKKVIRGKGMEKHYAFCIKIKEYISGETLRRAEYKRNSN